VNDIKKMLLLTVGACLVTLSGIGWLLYTAWFVGHAVKTQGQVVAMRHINGKGGDHYKPIFTFSDASGIAHTGCSDAPFGIGDNVTVFYDASKPEHAEIDSSWLWLNPLGLTLFAGFGSFVFGVRLNSLKSLT
jgi:hypothetical protein